LNQPSHSHNRLLASLSAFDSERLRPHLRPMKLQQGTVLSEVRDEIDCVYFPHTGVVSLVVTLGSGETIETGMIGRDSLLGGSSALHSTLSFTRSIVQIAGTASVIGSEHLISLASASTSFRTRLIQHEQLMLVQAQQSAACNIIHTVEARLARWLLRCRDLMDSDDLALTQEVIGQMLGVRRSSVSITAGTLQEAGLIRYSRGHIRIVDVDGLRSAACECYETVRSQSERLLGAV
jgi:CRP-like cAMP-binding protein